MNKVLTVFGATGKQGGSVINGVQAHPNLCKEFKFRGVTRDPSKPAAQELTKKGVGVVQADLGDKESVRKAVEGSYAVYGVTNYFELLSKDLELAQGRNIADACKATGVATSSGPLLPMPGKAEVEEYAREIGIPSTFFYPGVYMSNFPQFLQKSDNGYAMANNLATDAQVPLFEETNDTGKWVAGILAQPEKPSGKRVFGASGWYTPVEMMTAVEKVSGQKATFTTVPDQVYAGFLPPNIADELVETFLFLQQYGLFGPGAKEGVAEGLKLTTKKPTTWEVYVQSTWPWK